MGRVKVLVIKVVGHYSVFRYKIQWMGKFGNGMEWNGWIKISGMDGYCRGRTGLDWIGKSQEFP